MAKVEEMFEEDFERVQKISKQLRETVHDMDRQEARYLVREYYNAQQDRIRRNNQLRKLRENNLGCATMEWFADQALKLEKAIQLTLDVYSAQHPVGAFVRQIKGIGPVIAAGLLANFDITKAPSAGHFLSYAGQVSQIKWKKGEIPPWNLTLKRLCFIIGESFVKVSGGENPSPYGMLYKKWKETYIAMNEAGKLAKNAEEALQNKNFGKETEAYKAYIQGKLPPAHIHALARRKAVQLFLCHLHEFWFEWHYKKPAPEPYAIQHLGHVHRIPRPDKLDKSEWHRYFAC